MTFGITAKIYCDRDSRWQDAARTPICWWRVEDGIGSTRREATGQRLCADRRRYMSALFVNCMPDEMSTNSAQKLIPIGAI
jgi:hypothetical protein